MPTEFSINIKGIEEVTAALTKMPDRLVKNAFARALAASAVPIVEALKPRTPVDTGLLQSSIMADIQIDTTGKGGELAVGFGKQGYVARMIEYGHRIVGHEPKKKDTGKVVAGKPFMRGSAATSADASVDAFEESIRTSVESGI
jgi:hypothetical protein